jgi:replicative DNA helicase
MFIYRPETYYTREEWEKYKDLEKEPYPQGIAEIHIAKHRNGPTGMVQMRFIGRTTRFASLQAEVGQLAQEV